jgi:hypothetical protein
MPFVRSTDCTEGNDQYRGDLPLKRHRPDPRIPAKTHGLFRVRIYRSAAALAGLILIASHAIAGGLWVANEDSPTLVELQSELKGSKHSHHILDDSADLDGASTVAFQGGNLWVTNFNVNTITEFSGSEVGSLKTHSDPAAVVTISEDGGGFLNGPEGIVFDSSNNMGVGAEDGQVVLEYTPAQYAASGNPTPNVILNGDTFSFGSPSHLAFDSAGNLWVTDEDINNGNGGSGEIFRYNKSQITGLSAGMHNIDPAFGIAWSQSGEPETIAFDGHNNMWVADGQDNEVYQFAANQLAGTGLGQNLTPPIVLDSKNIGGTCPDSLNSPYGVAVNQNGNLLVSNANGAGGCRGSVVEFSAGKITSSGTPKPKVVISGNMNVPNALTIQP